MIIESIPLQEKIAELERRIEALEKGPPKVRRTVTRTFHSKPFDGIFGERWNKMWDEFNEMMKAVFR